MTSPFSHAVFDEEADTRCEGRTGRNWGGIFVDIEISSIIRGSWYWIRFFHLSIPFGLSICQEKFHSSAVALDVQNQIVTAGNSGFC